MLVSEKRLWNLNHHQVHKFVATVCHCIENIVSEFGIGKTIFDSYQGLVKPAGDPLELGQGMDSNSAPCSEQQLRITCPEFEGRVSFRQVWVRFKL